jgi:hypothetical protein
MFRKQIFCAALLSLITLSSCSSFKIVFPQGNDRSSFDAIEIKERMTFGVLDEKITIGSFIATIDRSWTKTDSSQGFQLFGSSKTVTAEQNYSFKITGPDDFNWDGKCAAGAEVEQETTKIFKYKTKSETVNQNNLMCEFKSGAKKIILYIEGPSSEKTGYIRSDTISLDIIMRFESMTVGKGWTGSNNTIGYQVYNKGVLIAVIGPGMNDKALYVRKGVDQKLMPILLNSTAALVAYEDMSKNAKSSGN